MIESFHLDLRSAPTDRPVDKSSFFAVHIYWFPHFLNTCCLGIKESTSCRYVQYFIIKSCVQINLEVSCSLHNKSGNSFLRVMDREAGARMSCRHQRGLIS